MTDPTDTHAYHPDPVAWTEDGREYTAHILGTIGASPDLMRTDPALAVRLIDEQLAEEGLDTPADEEAAHRLRALLLCVAGEFMINAFEGHWAWTVDPTSPLGGRWVVTGFPHPLGQRTHAVDVPGLSDEAVNTPPARIVHIVNRAVQLSGIRVFVS
ncbi:MULTISPECIES: hypothetical protein [Kitasatospora]|uniref:hypothetical protein n=1 Tax=Kitasatospora TaxID=2063 RepID=UPI0004C16214|nr:MULTISPECIES: hypothetical protein [Kitasatospora]